MSRGEAFPRKRHKHNVERVTVPDEPNYSTKQVDPPGRVTHRTVNGRGLIGQLVDRDRRKK